MALMKTESKSFNIINIILLAIMGLVTLYPFYNSLLVSIVPEAYYVRTPFMLFPQNINFDSYKFVFYSDRIWSGYLISVIMIILGIPYSMLLTVCMAYALSKRSFKGKNLVINMIIFTMFFGGGLIPYYILIKNLGLIDSILVLIIPQGINTFYMLIARNYFQTLPASIEESAKMDGANEITILFNIILPLSMPIMATVALFYAVDKWNEWFTAVLFIRDVKKQPLQFVLRSIIYFAGNVDAKGAPVALQQRVFTDGVKMASIFVVMAPVMIIYPFIQKYFMKGLLIGAIKS